MPIIRKLIQVGDSRAMTIPISWLRFYEKERGRKVEAVAIEVDHTLTIEPIFSEKREEKNAQERRR